MKVLGCGSSHIKYYSIKPEREKYRIFYSLGATIFLGLIFLILKGENIFEMISAIWSSIVHPFGTGRIGLTVAENYQPSLVDWINQMGKVFFWMFIAGLVFMGIELSKTIESKKEKYTFILLWILMFSGILFSRISQSSLFNGTNFISQAFYIIGILAFLGYSFKLCIDKKIQIRPELIVISIWMFFMLISSRSAIRFFFVLTSFVVFSSAFFVVKCFEYWKREKEEIIKFLLVIVLILGIIGSVYSIAGFYKSSNAQAKVIGPSADLQWQKTMKWVRENTPEKSLFIHWWDYGHWITYLGERRVVTDGGHANTYWDHLIGRYLLTTPYPYTALSLMKSHEVNYLLIDPSDLGKYGAYSKIAGDDNNDRFSQIPSFLIDESQTRETINTTLRLYRGGTGVDQDIIYEDKFIPGPTYDEAGNPTYNAQIGAVILETDKNSLKKIEGIFLYGGEQIRIPIRYIYLENKIVDLNVGIDAVFYTMPLIDEQKIDGLGAGLYLSPKVSKSLFAQLYLMNDAFGNYPTLKLVHSELDSVNSQLRNGGINVGDIVYYQGFRGPIKIWEVQYPKDLISRDEFRSISGSYAEFDNLQVKEFK